MRITYSGDANGNRLSAEVDFDLDGSADRRTTYTYDENGNLTNEDSDDDVDGTVDRSTIYTYDGHDNVLTRRTEPSGTQYTYTYDCWE